MKMSSCRLFRRLRTMRTKKNERWIERIEGKFEEESKLLFDFWLRIGKRESWAVDPHRPRRHADIFNIKSTIEMKPICLGFTRATMSESDG